MSLSSHLHNYTTNPILYHTHQHQELTQYHLQHSGDCHCQTPDITAYIRTLSLSLSLPLQHDMMKPYIQVKVLFVHNTTRHSLPSPAP